jgi:hypothetical protein
MKKSPYWKVNSRSGNQIPNLLWIPKVQWSVQKESVTGPFSQPVESSSSLTSYSFKIHFNIILSSMPRLSGLFLLGFDSKIL